MLQIKFRVILICLIPLFFLMGCANKEEATRKGLTSLPEVVKFNSLFKKTNQKIGYHGGIGTSLCWISKAIIYDRYSVFMVFDVKVNINNIPKRVSSTKYYISKFKEEDPAKSGGYSRSTLGEISESQWKKVKKVEDIFEILKHKPVTNKPVKGIEDELFFY